ncbi:MAG TPA: GLPGLI family protein [Chitinophagaceae bacterium]|nr:GLPGLI family protein [Chitinophagaceae bacterium]
MKIIHLSLALLLSVSQPASAQQARFINNGSIEYEKTVNVYALIKEGQLLVKKPAGNEQQLFEQYQKTQQQFTVLKSTLQFSDNKTLFVPGGPETSPAASFGILMAAQNNTVYTNLLAGTQVIQKSIFDETFLLNDSIRSIRWKITDETREIAGYTCRRANALILDSIYVVAFYAEQIHVPGGPESFAGLPGMILQVALPHEHVVWRAVKVMETVIPAGAMLPPKRGKPTSHQQLINMLLEAGKNRNPQAARLILKVNLL